MKSILILCDMFPPAFGPRMGYLCKYLKNSDWHPVVFTEYIEDKTFDFLKGKEDVTYVNYYTKKGVRGKMEWGWVFLRNIIFGYKDRRMYDEAKKAVLKHKFDLILCSTYRTFPLVAAWKLSKHTGLPLIVDLRDIIEQYAGNEFISHRLPKLFGLESILASYFRKHSLKQRNRVLRDAACVTTVSPWHVSVLKQYCNDVNLIYNGFDSDKFYPVQIETEQFYITYTGRLLSTAMRNPELLFMAVERLAKEGVITPDMFQVRWFVDEASQRIIEKAVLQYPAIADYMDYFGYVPATEIPKILNESSVILLLTNKSSERGPKGIMTTKFFEALAVGKPILCVRGDEDCLEEVINRTRSGLSAHNVDETYSFIKQHYLHWKEKRPYIDESDKNEIRKFSREAQAAQFVKIFERTVNVKS